jgi:hypothetical protein
MPLFRKDPNALPRGSWIEDPLGRFDQRLLVEVSMHMRNWGEHVRLDGDIHRDPLPPHFSLSWSEQFDMMRMRAQSTVSRRKAKVRLKSMTLASQFYENKIAGLFAVIAPSFPADRGSEFESMIASAMQISGGDYLDGMGANASHREAFQEVCEMRDPRAHLAWFWDVDDYFQMPNFHDDLLFRGGQQIVQNIGLAERSWVGPPLPQ